MTSTTTAESMSGNASETNHGAVVVRPSTPTSKRWRPGRASPAVARWTRQISQDSNTAWVAIPPHSEMRQ
jgi:hypothetical protein